MQQLVDRFGPTAAERKAMWCEEVGLVTKDPQNEEDSDLWLYEVGTGPKSSTGWRSCSSQAVSGGHAPPPKDRPPLLLGHPDGPLRPYAATERNGLCATSAGPLCRGKRRGPATQPAAIETTAPKAKAKAKGKAKGKAKASARPLAERLADLRARIYKEIEAVRNMVKEVAENPMAQEMAQWMDEYTTEMANLTTAPTQQNDEAAPVSLKRPLET